MERIRSERPDLDPFGFAGSGPSVGKSKPSVGDQRKRTLGLYKSSAPSSSSQTTQVRKSVVKNGEGSKSQGQGQGQGQSKKGKGPAPFPLDFPSQGSSVPDKEEDKMEVSRSGKENLKGGAGSLAGKGKGKGREKGKGKDEERDDQDKEEGMVKKKKVLRRSEPFPLDTPPSSRNTSTASRNLSSSQSIVEINGPVVMAKKKGREKEKEKEGDEILVLTGSSAPTRPLKYTPAPTTARPGGNPPRRPPPTNATQTTPPKRPKPNHTDPNGRSLISHPNGASQGTYQATASQIRQRPVQSKRPRRVDSPTTSVDSPDPLALSHEDGSPGRSSGILIPSSPVVSRKEKKSIEGDKTAVEKPKPKEGGDLFFAEMSRMSFGEETLKGGAADDLLEDLEGDDEEDVDGEWDVPELTEKELEEKAYLEQYIDRDTICPYCSEPLPLDPSPYLKSLEAQLISLSTPAPTAYNPGARKISWAKTTEYCCLHEAETSVIPLGLRKGYPDTIVFEALEARLEGAWIRHALADIVVDPTKSKSYKECMDEMEKMGKLRWRSMDWQGVEHVQDRTMVGYYGDLGRSIIQTHLQNLLQWGCFPTLTPPDDRPPTCFPLHPVEFIRHVLAPEASIRLIMEDEGWVGEDVSESEEYNERYDLARTKWSESREYGSWKFRNEAEEAKKIVENLRIREKETKKSARRVRGVRRKKDRIKGGTGGGTGSQPIIFEDEDEQAPIDISNSQRTEITSDLPSTPVVMDSTPRRVLVAASSTPLQPDDPPAFSGVLQYSQETDYGDAGMEDAWNTAMPATDGMEVGKWVDVRVQE